MSVRARAGGPATDSAPAPAPTHRARTLVRRRPGTRVLRRVPARSRSAAAAPPRTRAGIGGHLPRAVLLLPAAVRRARPPPRLRRDGEWSALPGWWRRP